jgi:hypothetical protein
MKKRYQIDQQRAVQQFRRLATEQNPNIQMILPMADIVGLLGFLSTPFGPGAPCGVTGPGSADPAAAA